MSKTAYIHLVLFIFLDVAKLNNVFLHCFENVVLKKNLILFYGAAEVAPLKTEGLIITRLSRNVLCSPELKIG